MEESNQRDMSADSSTEQACEDDLSCTRGLLERHDSSKFRIWALPRRLQRNKNDFDSFHKDSLDLKDSSDFVIHTMRAQKRSIRKWRLVTIILSSTTIALATYSLFSTTRHGISPTYPEDDTYKSCGSSTSTALDRGCDYHPLSHSWLPGQCNISLATEAVNFDSEVLPKEEFWLDQKGTRPLRSEDWKGLETGTSVWTTQSHHVTHCVYLLAQAAAAVTTGGMMEENARKWEHQKLCIETILNAAKHIPGWNDMKGFVQTGSRGCS